MFQKKRGKTPQIIHSNRVFHYFYHPFGFFFPPIFGSTSIYIFLGMPGRRHKIHLFALGVEQEVEGAHEPSWRLPLRWSGSKCQRGCCLQDKRGGATRLGVGVGYGRYRLGLVGVGVGVGVRTLEEMLILWEFFQRSVLVVAVWYLVHVFAKNIIRWLLYICCYRWLHLLEKNTQSLDLYW